MLRVYPFIRPVQYGHPFMIILGISGMLTANALVLCVRWLASGVLHLQGTYMRDLSKVFVVGVRELLLYEACVAGQ